MKGKYHYPGDPVTGVELTYGGDFKRAQPDRQIRVGIRGGEVSVIPVEDAICDMCNAEVGDYNPCALSGTRLYCWQCYEEWIKPYLVTK